ncbi:hypothetical protein [Clostridium sp.]|uniref:hypothetical protein n=1 Tax=Clostridium sp. TaxID=1506 RepID=UPI001B72E639|nr:hypothetical protein [Clostridium sp.]MBP3916276.1 hypothetical protein [Clostridium sp.]MEE0932255.1 hypothetical protein [Clostridium sp.]
MKIEKALKKQKKYNKLFIVFMFFLAILLPIITYLAYVNSFAIVAFLVLIELLIFIAIIRKINSCTLKFDCINNKLKFSTGLFSNYAYIQCDRVEIVHTNKSNENMEIIIVTKGKIKNQKMKPINKEFIKKYEEAAVEYRRLKRINKGIVCYFKVIRNGELKKYILLDNIYRNCVNATYTTSAIDNIKIARGQKEI